MFGVGWGFRGIEVRYLFTRLFGAAICSMSISTGFAQSCDAPYVVKTGDTLSLIAERVYGSVLEYERLHLANRDIIGPDPSILVLGETIYIPCTEQAATFVSIPTEQQTATVDTAYNFADNWNVQLNVDQVAALLDDQAIQLVDIRPAKDHGDGIIAGAISMPFSDWRGEDANPNLPPSDAKLSTVIGSAGLRLDLPIVITGANDAAFETGRAAYVYWLLKSAGAERIALMTGGHKAWASAGLPQSDTPQVFAAYTADLHIADTWRATTEDVRAISEGEAPGVLVDARPDKMFNKRAKDGTQLASTLPGAANISVPASHSLLSKSNNDPLTLLTRLKDQSVNWKYEPVINFCNTGELGALNWFHASEVVGIENVKLYPESSHGWVDEGLELSTASPNN